MGRICALFVDPLGHYPRLLGSDNCWDKARDARTYALGYPIVAHPPCHLWTNLAAVNFKRYGGEHNRPGNDGGNFKFALDTVRHCTGVLEHPAFSTAWKTYSLARPIRIGWNRVSDHEWVCEVWQSAYGHACRKRTWILYVGDFPPYEGNWERHPGTHQIGWFDRIKPTLGKRDAMASPARFCEWLISLAHRAAYGR